MPKCNLSRTNKRKRQLALSTYNLKPLKTSADPSNELRLLGMRNVPTVPFFVFPHTCGGDFFKQGVNAWGGTLMFMVPMFLTHIPRFMKNVAWNCNFGVIIVYAWKEGIP